MQQIATVNISFPKTLLKDIDAVALEESRTRSELLREATRIYIERKRRWGSLFALWRAETKKVKLKPTDIERAIQRVRNNHE